MGFLFHTANNTNTNATTRITTVQPPILSPSVLTETLDMSDSHSLNATTTLTSPSPLLEDYLKPVDLTPLVDWCLTPVTGDIPSQRHAFLPTSPMSAIEDDSDVHSPAPFTPADSCITNEKNSLLPMHALIQDDHRAITTNECFVDEDQTKKAVLELENVLGSPACYLEKKNMQELSFRSRRGRRGGRRPRAKEDEEEMERMRDIYARVVMKQKKKRYKVAKPSNFCHICGRKAWLTQIAICGNLINRDCRKVICKQCFEKFNMDTTVLQKALMNDKVHVNEFVDPEWKCPHCRDACPTGSQCSTYKVTNYKRHVRLKNNRALKNSLNAVEKTIRKNEKEKSNASVTVLTKEAMEELTMSDCSDGFLSNKEVGLPSSARGCERVLEAQSKGTVGVDPCIPVKQEPSLSRAMQPAQDDEPKLEQPTNPQVSDAMASLLFNSFRR